MQARCQIAAENGLSRKSFHLLVKKGVATVEGKNHSSEPCLAMFGMLSDRLQASAPARSKDPAANLTVNAAGLSSAAI
jgi:hypothetical protein